MISRARSAGGLLVLRPATRKELSARPPQYLLDELKRLSDLEKNSEAELVSYINALDIVVPEKIRNLLKSEAADEQYERVKKIRECRETSKTYDSASKKPKVTSTISEERLLQKVEEKTLESTAKKQKLTSRSSSNQKEEVSTPVSQIMQERPIKNQQQRAFTTASDMRVPLRRLSQKTPRGEAKPSLPFRILDHDGACDCDVAAKRALPRSQGSNEDFDVIVKKAKSDSNEQDPTSPLGAAAHKGDAPQPFDVPSSSDSPHHVHLPIIIPTPVEALHVDSLLGSPNADISPGDMSSVEDTQSESFSQPSAATACQKICL